MQQLPAEERTNFLDQVFTSRPDLRKAMDAYLHNQEVGSFVEEPLQVLKSAVFNKALGIEDPDLLVGQKIGAYQVLQVIGKGGMGLVYKAKRQDDKLEQTVALKVMAHEWGRSDLRQRFQRERQVLVNLNHPNTVKLFDVGVTDEGRLWYAMEYIEGQPITEYAHQQKLTIEQRLSLFKQVCQAVQHAHQNLVVHRDIKPFNVFVRKKDGLVKVLDFGLAKLLDAKTEETLQTETGQQLLTWAYAAPEQIKGAQITTATDVYALGVLLYELLTGCRPFAHPDLVELARQIKEDPPIRPSDATTQVSSPSGLPVTSSSFPEMGQQRHPAAAALQRQLRGDLDNIIMKALRKYPEKRYPSVEAFAQDLERYLTGQPVLARPASLLYRTGKFIGRHKWGVAMTALLLFIVAGFTWQNRQERNRAIQEAQKAEQVKDFLIDIFDQSNPARSLGTPPTALDLLEQAAPQIEKRLQEQPALAADLLDAVGLVYYRLGVHTQAEEKLVQAREVYKHLESRDASGELRTQLHLAQLYNGQGRRAKADSLLGTLLQQPGLASDIEADLWYQLAIIKNAQNNYREADSLSQLALLERRRLYGKEHIKIARSLNTLGIIRQNQGQYAEAENFLQRALEMRRKYQHDLDPGIIRNMQNLANVYYYQSKLNKADSLFSVLLEKQKVVLGETHPDLIGMVNNLAVMKLIKTEYQAADSLYGYALDIHKASNSENQRLKSTILLNRAMVKENSGALPEARSLYEASLELSRSLGYKGDIAQAANNLGSLLLNNGQHREAALYLHEALALWEENRGDHDYTIQTLYNLGTLYAETGAPAQADSFYTASITMSLRLGDDAIKARAMSLSGLALLNFQMNDAATGATLTEEALQIRDEVMKGGDRYPSQVENTLGMCLVYMERFEQAEPILVESLNQLRVEKGDHHLRTRQALERIIMLYKAWGKPAQAEPYKVLAKHS